MAKSSKVRIAILTNYPANGKNFSGGVETATQGLLDGLQDYRHQFELHIVSLSKDIEKDKQVQWEGFTFHFLSVPRNPVLRPHLPYNIMKAFFKLKEISPRIVHCHDNMALAVASILSAYPRIFTIHGIKKIEAKLWRGKEYWSYQIDRILERFVHRHFNTFIANSSYVLNFLNHRKRIFNIPNSISRQFFTSTKKVLNSAEKCILYVGPLVYLKQVHVLINAFINLKNDFVDLKLIICGNQEDNPYYKRLENSIKESGVSDIRFVEHLSREELKDCYKRASMLVLPSLQENSPMVIAEAMGVGLPVIASRVGGIPYMIEHKKTGLLFEPTNVDELVKCIRLLLSDKDLYKCISFAARQKAEELYQPNNIAAETVKVYRKFLSTTYTCLQKE